MTEDVNYVIPDGIEFHLHKACETCKYWDAKMAVNGWATCFQLVHSGDGKTDMFEHVPEDSVAVVKTRKGFNCKYWKGK